MNPEQKEQARAGALAAMNAGWSVEARAYLNRVEVRVRADPSKGRPDEEVATTCTNAGRVDPPCSGGKNLGKTFFRASRIQNRTGCTPSHSKKNRNLGLRTHQAS